MINMVNVYEGKVFDLGIVKVMAVLEEKHSACIGCFFDSVETSYINCSKIIKNCPSNKLIFKEVPKDMINIICLKDFQTRHTTFRKGEIYTASKVNENWYSVEAVGVSTEDFSKYFKIQE